MGDCICESVLERVWVEADLSEKILSIVERAGLKVMRGVPADCGGMLLVQDTVGRHLGRCSSW